MKDMHPGAASLSGSPVTAVAVGHQPNDPCSRTAGAPVLRVHRR